KSKIGKAACAFRRHGLSESVQNTDDSSQVGGAKKVQMDQQRIQIKEILTFLPTGGERKAGLIGFVKPGVEAPEQSGECDFGFAMAVIHGRIDQDRLVGPGT